jgi:hypothetical protein
MGTKYWEAVCDVHGIGGSGEYFGDNDAYLGRINVFYHVKTVETCVENSKPHTGARPSVRLCAGPELARCVHNYT